MPKGMLCRARARAWRSIWTCSAAGTSTGDLRSASLACIRRFSRMHAPHTLVMHLTPQHPSSAAALQTLSSHSAPLNGVIICPYKRVYREESGNVLTVLVYLVENSMIL